MYTAKIHKTDSEKKSGRALAGTLTSNSDSLAKAVQEFAGVVGKLPADKQAAVERITIERTEPDTGDALNL